jgi:hypothetical protein
MRMTVITDTAGAIVSVYMHPAAAGENLPTLRIWGGPGHTTHEVDVPDDYEAIESVEELHARVSDHLKK